MQEMDALFLARSYFFFAGRWTGSMKRYMPERRTPEFETVSAWFKIWNVSERIQPMRTAL